MVGFAVVDESKMLLTVTETGIGRRSAFEDYRTQNRGGLGLINYKTEKYGKVAAVLAVAGDEDAILITSNGLIIRIDVSTVNSANRPGKGVTVMRFKSEDERVAAVQLTEHEEDSAAEETEEENGAPASTPEGVQEAYDAVMANAERNGEEEE